MHVQQTPAALPPPLRVCELGLVPYAEALSLQQQVSERRQAEEVPDTLLLLEHPPTYTRGRRAGDGAARNGPRKHRGASTGGTSPWRAPGPHCRAAAGPGRGRRRCWAGYGCGDGLPYLAMGPPPAASRGWLVSPTRWRIIPGGC